MSVPVANDEKETSAAGRAWRPEAVSSDLLLPTCFREDIEGRIQRGLVLDEDRMTILRVFARVLRDEPVTDRFSLGFYAYFDDNYIRRIRPWVGAHIHREQTRANAKLGPEDQLDFSNFDVDRIWLPTSDSGTWSMRVGLYDYEDFDAMFELDGWRLTRFYFE